MATYILYVRTYLITYNVEISGYRIVYVVMYVALY